MKKYSKTFWFTFWILSAVFLSGWYFFWETKNQGLKKTVGQAVKVLPLGQKEKQDYKNMAKLVDYFVENDGRTRTLMVLLENNLELRPGGGFIGAFGIVKIKDGQVVLLETHDLSNFDARVPDTLPAPYPLAETLRVKSWKLRDSNYSPDFETNAKQALKFYYLGQGQEQFDAVIGLTSNVLSSMLKVTGPIQVDGYPGTYDSNNAIISLEYQVEKAFEQQGIDRGDRKNIMSDLAKEIEKRIATFSAAQKIELAKVLLEDLEHKDIQLYFVDTDLQQTAEASNWAGSVDENWNRDYLMVVDANLGSFKSDYYMKRSLDYSLDLSGDAPRAKLKITYEHTAKQKDWMTRDYTDYLRVYVPAGAWLTDQHNFDGTRFGNEFGKKYFGAIVRVPIGTSKTVEINYTLPKEIANDYDLKIQKQAGVTNVPVSFHLTRADSSQDGFSKLMNSDLVLSDSK